MSLRITRLINAAMHRWVKACEKILSLLSPHHVDSRLSATLLQSRFLPLLRVSTGLYHLAVRLTATLPPNITGFAGFAYPYKYVFLRPDCVFPSESGRYGC